MAISVDDAVTTRSARPATSVKALGSAPLADFYLIIFTVTILCAIGSLMVLSASSVLATAQGQSPFYYSIRQLIFLAVGAIGAALISRLQPSTIRRMGWLGWGVSAVALMLVLSPLGHHAYGNTNWINIAGFTFQPSEFAKLGIIIWGASIYHTRRGRLHETTQLLLPFMPGALLLLALVLAGKDLGTGMVLGIVVLALLFFVGTSFRLLVPMVLGAVAVVAVFVLGSENRMRRFTVFFDPLSNTDASSQPMAALYALASGGWWGLGLGASKQKWGGLKNAAHTDYILAVIGEELGLFGVLLVIAMFVLLARAGFSVALKSDKIFTRLVAAGVTAWFVTQALINIMVVLHLLPVLGVPLPFISSGGSGLLSNLFGVGALLACARATPAARRHLASKPKKSRPRMTSVLAAGGGR